MSADSYTYSDDRDRLRSAESESGRAEPAVFSNTCPMSRPHASLSPESGTGSSHVDPEDNESDAPADLKAKYNKRKRECHSLKEQLEKALRKEQELSRQLREKQVILDYLEKKIFDQKESAGFAESTPMPGRGKFFLPTVTPIFPPFSRPPAHYQPAADHTATPASDRRRACSQMMNESTEAHPHMRLSPSKYRMPNFDWTPAASSGHRAADAGEPIDFRKRKCTTPVTSTLMLSKRGSGAAPIVIEEIFPELSGMCKPYVRICLVGGSKSFFCVHPNCNGRELNGNVWRKHYTSHFPEPDCRSPYRCPKCNQGFDLYRPLSKHFPGCGVDPFAVN